MKEELTKTMGTRAYYVEKKDATKGLEGDRRVHRSLLVLHRRCLDVSGERKDAEELRRFS